VNGGRGIGKRSAAHARRATRRGWAAAGSALLAAAVALAAFGVFGGGAPAAAALAESYAHDWALHDWTALYANLDSRSQSALPLARFVSIERQDVALATATRVSVGAASAAAGGRYNVSVRVRTRIFGTLDERFTLTLTGHSGSPKIHWNWPASFPGLGGAERLRRADTAPARGVLLARDGTPLSQLPSASNLIGDVGPASGSLLQRSVAAGFAPGTPVGLDGLEHLFQQELGGTPGGSLYAGNRLLASAAPRAGANVRTSISPALQALAVVELGTSLGGIVVMEPSTGELLAAAGAPLSELQPPGSTFKIVTLTGVLEAHLSKAHTVYPYASSTVLDGFTLHDSNGESCGGTLANAFAVSCNSVFAPLGARLGASRMLAAARAYGFDAPSPISIAAESTVPPSSLTDDLQLGESAIGQAQVLASPLQMARVAATIALVGRRPVPTFAIVAPRRFPRVLPVSVARTIRALMRDVVSYGTGTGAQIPGVVVAGKTGTADVITPPPCSTGATGASGASGTTAAGTPLAAAASASSGPLARAAANDTGASSDPSGTGGVNAPTGAGSTGGAGGPGGGSTSAGSGAGGTSGPTTGGGSGSAAGSSGASGAASPSGSSGAGRSGGATGTGRATGSNGASGSNGATGATGCAAFDTNPYDTDAWFVAFAPETHPRFVVAVLLPHDGAGGTTAAPLAKAILEQALSRGT
jgi:peptidoglycan glycosyltransferase